MPEDIEYRESKDVSKQAVLDLYRANNWSSANKPEQLHQALLNSHSLVTASLQHTAWHDAGSLKVRIESSR